MAELLSPGEAAGPAQGDGPSSAWRTSTNSTKNPVNPDPSKQIRFGEQTWDEMMIGFIDFYRDEPVKTTAANQNAAPAQP